jgi:hypothetical protein
VSEVGRRVWIERGIRLGGEASFASTRSRSLYAEPGFRFDERDLGRANEVRRHGEYQGEKKRPGTHGKTRRNAMSSG